MYILVSMFMTGEYQFLSDCNKDCVTSSNGISFLEYPTE